MEKTTVALSEQQIAELRQAFLLFDQDKQGVVSSKELRLVIESLGLYEKLTTDHQGVPITELQILTILEQLGVHTQSLDFPEFLALFQEWEMKERNQSREHNATFDLMDRSGKGYVTLEELRKFLQSIGESMSNSDFEKFMKESDIVNADGVVTREAFLQLFRSEL